MILTVISLQLHWNINSITPTFLYARLQYSFSLFFSTSARSWGASSWKDLAGSPGAFPGTFSLSSWCLMLWYSALEAGEKSPRHFHSIVLWHLTTQSLHDVIIKSYMACYNEVLQWGVTMRCYNEVLKWGVTMRCYNEVLQWGVMMRCYSEVLQWGVMMRCYSEVLQWRVTMATKKSLSW